MKQHLATKNRVKTTPAIELIIIFTSGIVVYLLAGLFDILEHIVAFSKAHEKWEIDELLTVSIFLTLMLAIHSFRQWRRVQKSETELSKKYKELKNAYLEIKQLRGIIPICASCKKIRHDNGFWEQVEVYIKNHTKAEFSHGICPECAKKLYPDLKMKPT